MIVEYIRYQIEPARQEAFEQAYADAQVSLGDSPHCHGWELSQAVEDPSSYVLRIEWDSAEGHLEGFRRSPGFRTFLAAVRPYVNDIQEMRHYRPTDVRSYGVR